MSKLTTSSIANLLSLVLGALSCVLLSLSASAEEPPKHSGARVWTHGSNDGRGGLMADSIQWSEKDRCYLVNKINRTASRRNGEIMIDSIGSRLDATFGVEGAYGSFPGVVADVLPGVFGGACFDNTGNWIMYGHMNGLCAIKWPSILSKNRHNYRDNDSWIDFELTFDRQWNQRKEPEPESNKGLQRPQPATNRDSRDNKSKTQYLVKPIACSPTSSQIAILVQHAPPMRSELCLIDLPLEEYSGESRPYERDPKPVTATVKPLIAIHENAAVTDVQFSPAGDYVAYASSQGSVMIWNTKTGECVDELTVMDGLSSIAFIPDKTVIAIANSPTFAAGGKLLLYDFVKRETQGECDLDRAAFVKALSNERVVVVSRGGHLSLVDVKACNVTFTCSLADIDLSFRDDEDYEQVIERIVGIDISKDKSLLCMAVVKEEISRHPVALKADGKHLLILVCDLNKLTEGGK